jgi:signal transduction histidine kinase/ABC-type uncharacterized transport system substrate-binding protein
MVLYSFGRDFRPWSEYAKVIRSELERQSPWPLDIFDFSLVTARFNEDDAETPFVNFLRELYSKHSPDLIISLGAPAAGFIQRHRQQLFASTPMLFTAVEQRRVRLSVLTENDAVVAVAHDLPAVIENIFRVLPDTETIAVVNGNSPLEKFWFEEMQREFKPFENRAKFIWYNTLSFDDILKHAASLPPRSAIFWELLIVDASGAVYEGDRALTKVHAVANAPIFSFDDSFFGRELVGGPMHAVLEVSQQTAAVAVRILGGEKPGNIKTPPIGFAAPKFDWRQMQRWNISESLLPTGSEVYFRDATTWEQYRQQILPLFAVLLMQAALICWLVYEHRRRGRAEVLARHSMAELAHMDRIATAGELSASIAHEVSQPLTGISTRASAALRWLRAEKPDLERVGVSLEHIVTASHHASDIVASIRTLFKRSETLNGPVDINSLIIAVLSLLRMDLYKHDVRVRTELGPQLPPVNGDKVQLQQVLLNLIKNAIEAMHAAHPHILEIRTYQSNANAVRVSIEDTGAGIDQSDLKRIFDPLFTTKSDGMGMGLSICRSIIESHGGRIWVAPAPGGGSLFQFELPAS